MSQNFNRNAFTEHPDDVLISVVPDAACPFVQCGRCTNTGCSFCLTGQCAWDMFHGAGVELASQQKPEDYCELCGRLDLHLQEGACAWCRDRYGLDES